MVKKLRERIAVIGSGAWGTTLAAIQADAGHAVRLYVRDPNEAAAISRTRENSRLLPDIELPASLEVSPDLEFVMHDSALVLMVAPSQSMRANSAAIAPFVGNAVVVSCTKGLDRSTLMRMTQVIRAEIQPDSASRVCALSGPNLATEIARGQPATTVIAGEDAPSTELARDLLMTPQFRTYTNHDVIGVEIGGALKNVIAIGAGISDGLGAGDNAKAAFITRGIAEIARLGMALGAHPLTFAGLSGLGDLIATCASTHSRNRHVGVELARGKSLTEIQSAQVHVAEGVFTTDAACALARQVGIELPIAEQISAILFEGKSALAAIADLMRRDAKDELEGIRYLAGG